MKSPHISHYYALNIGTPCKYLFIHCLRCMLLLFLPKNVKPQALFDFQMFI